ncbi:ATP-binding protein, partial [Arcobacteraceae bacterium]|nr:ATP-binding protein [Arcobacteraceae bacterium]
DGKIIFFRKQFAAKIKNFLRNNNEFKKAVINSDQQKIEKILNKLFKALKKETKYSKVIHLISKDNISLYRAHLPKIKGDDLSKFRPIVVSTNKDKRAKYGFETGLYTLVYRVDIPVIYNGVHYGVLEYGLDPKLFINDLTSVSNYIESALLLKIKKFHQLTLHNKKIEKNVLNKSENYALFDDDNFFKNVNLSVIERDHHFTQGKESYTSFLYDLLNFNAEKTGTIFIAVNMTADKNRFNNIIFLSIINQLLLVFIIYLVVYYAFRYYENKITKLTELEKQNERMIYQQSKMASMGEMIGNIAHQWRQPLSTISTVASGINVKKEYGIFDEATLPDSMDMIIKQTEYMSQTIEDFRDFFKSDKEKVEFSLDYVLKQNITLIESSLKGNDIQLDYTRHDDVILHGYQNELTQALLNILSNSKDQLINLAQEKSRHILVETLQEQDNVVIKIIDNGGGIPENIINKIFDPYFTTKHQSQGTGIGLYMTHEIINKHFNGKIEAYNEEITFDNEIYTCAVFKVTLSTL